MADIKALYNLVMLLEDIGSNENINSKAQAKYIATFNFLVSQSQNRELQLKRIEGYETFYDLYSLIQDNLLLINKELDKPISGDQNIVAETNKLIVSLTTENAKRLSKQKKHPISISNPELAEIMHDQKSHDDILDEILSEEAPATATDRITEGERGSLLRVTNGYMKHLEDEIWEIIYHYRYLSGFTTRNGVPLKPYENISRESAFEQKNRNELNLLIKTTIDQGVFDAFNLHTLKEKYRVMLEMQTAINNPDTQKSAVLTVERKQILSEHRDSDATRGIAAFFAVFTLFSLPFVWARTGNLFGSLFTSRGEKVCHDLQKILGSPEQPAATPQNRLTR